MASLRARGDVIRRVRSDRRVVRGRLPWCPERGRPAL